MRPKVRKLMWIAPLAIIGMALFVVIGGEIVKVLWNWLLPPLFGWHPLTFWQALGMLALCRILFGGMGLRGGARSSWRRHREDREQFRQRIRKHWGLDPSAGETQTP